MDPQMTAEKLAAVLDKIEKLKALAKGAGTQAEAEAAAAQAEALIAKYHVEEADLEARSGTTEEAEDGGIIHRFPNRTATWIQYLATLLANLHGCYAITTKGGVQPTIRIFGRQSEVTIVRYLFGWLTYEIDRLAQQENGKADRNAFRLGAVRGVTLAMRRAQQEAFAGQQSATTSKSATSTAMVLTSHRDEAEACALRVLMGEHPRTKVKTEKTRGPRRSSAEAYFRGKTAGDGLTPRAGLNAGSPTPMLTR